MSGKMAEQMIDDAITYGTGFFACSYEGFFDFSERNNPYSWNIKYFDDWRCIVDFLREIAQERNR